MSTRATYTIGPPMRPTIKHDNGFLDVFPKRPPTAADIKKFVWWGVKLEGAEALQHVPLAPSNNIPDALAAYRHFREGHGHDRQFSYERYVANDSSGSVTLKNAVLDAQEGAEQLYSDHFSDEKEAKFPMTSTAVGAGRKGDSLFPYPSTENWQKAIGAHSFWISADVEVEGGKSFRMKLTLHVEDMYNFNPGMKDIATGIPDEENGVFEITGLAKQYMNYSTLKRDVTWQRASAADKSKVTSPSSGRERQPGDNRRLRNKL